MSDVREVLEDLAMFRSTDYRGPCWCPETLREAITIASRTDGSWRASHTGRCERARRLFDSLTEPGED